MSTTEHRTTDLARDMARRIGDVCKRHTSRAGAERELRGLGLWSDEVVPHMIDYLKLKR